MSDAPSPGPGAPPPLPPERAVFQTTEQTRTYPCASCGATLAFDAATQKLRCGSCGTQHDIVDDPAATIVERDFAAGVQALRAQAAAGPAGPQLDGEKEVVCQSCGGHTTFTGTLTATRCPYCATPIQRDDVHDAPTRLAVDGVLPFRVDEKTARAKVEGWINSRRFAPSEFKRYRQTGSFTSVYAAYFTYDAATSTWYRGERGRRYTVTVGSGDNRRTETRVDWTPVQGQVANEFDDITVLANTGFEADKVKALEPWPTHEVKPFNPQYIAGHLCRTYDHDVEECFAEAERTIDATVLATVRRDIGGDDQRVHQRRTTYHRLTYKHLLLPIWLLTVIYAGRPFQVFINGVTGEVQGERPWSKVKIAVAVLVAVAVIAAVAVLLASRGGSSG